MGNHTTAQSGISSAASTLKLIALLAGPIGALILYLVLGSAIGEDSGLSEPGRRAAAMLVWMAIWWLSEAIPLAATSLLPIILSPALGIMPLADASAPFAHRVIFLFLGGFLLALAMERWGLHRRIALITVLIVGTRPIMLVAGFMIATAMLSMWMSNTATAVMMFPIGISIIRLVDDHTEGQGSSMAVCLMLGIAYAASIGGVATPIGTPPNAILLGFLSDSYGMDISFLRWMGVGLPVTVVFLPICWLLLTRVIYPIRLKEIPGGRELIRKELRELGPVTRAERTVMVVFSLTVLGWIFRVPLGEMLPGSIWAGIDDTTIALTGALALFIIPVNFKQRVFTLNWDVAEKVPWGVLLLFGGGLSLAAAVRAGGLDIWIGQQFEGIGGLPTILVIVLLCGTLIFLTEFTSNTATANLFFPVIAAVAPALGIDPLLLLAPVCVGVSCAFMMPMATPPNALVFATGKVTIRQMAKAGLLLNLISIVLVTILAYTSVVWILGASTSGPPPERQTTLQRDIAP